LIPALLWLLAIFARPYIIRPACAEIPGSCTAANVLPIDRPGLGLESPAADEYSNVTQILSGVVAFSVPPIWNASLAFMGRISPWVALTQTAVDTVIFVQTSAWNGLATESARLLVQRPRPFVYSRPQEGANSSNYTSFYSGHTSFAATSNATLFLTLLGRHCPTFLLIAVAALAQVLIFSTAFFRILAGRHFVTDVLSGAVAGGLVALAVAFFHRSSSNSKTQSK
jgi:membrane-associated phospholipid phosphatase